jgi:isoleucyl-tRNA synthetase
MAIAKSYFLCQRKRKLEGIIKSQLNVKGVEYKSPASKETELLVELDTKITSELEAEGYSRNIIRNIQAFRKQLGLQQGYEVETIIVCDDKLKEMLEEYKKLVAEKTNSKVLNVVTELKQTFKNKTHFKIKDKEGEIVIIDKK